MEWYCWLTAVVVWYAMAYVGVRSFHLVDTGFHRGCQPQVKFALWLLSPLPPFSFVSLIGLAAAVAVVIDVAIDVVGRRMFPEN